MMPCANVGLKPWYRCVCTDDTPRPLGDAGRMTFLLRFVPRTEPPVQIREVGQDRGHLLTESCSDVHVDVEPGVTTAAAVAWEAGAKISLLVLALSLIGRGCCCSVNRSSTGCCSSTCCCCCWCFCVRCSSTRRWWSAGSHPTESLVEQNFVSSGYGLYIYICLMGPKQLSHGIQTGKKQRKTTINVKNTLQRMHMHLLVRDNTWAGPSNPRASPCNCRTGPYRARVSWASLPCDGPGRAVIFKKVMGWAGPRPILGKFDGPGRAVAHHIKN